MLPSKKQYYFLNSSNLDCEYKLYLGARRVNLAFITGKLVNIQDMTENVKIGRLEDEKEAYLILWQGDLIPKSAIGKQISVVANIEMVKIKLEDKVKPYLTTAYKVREVQIIDDI